MSQADQRTATAKEFRKIAALESGMYSASLAESLLGDALRAGLFEGTRFIGLRAQLGISCSIHGIESYLRANARDLGIETWPRTCSSCTEVCCLRIAELLEADDRDEDDVPPEDARLWAPIRWISANSSVTSDDVRSAIYRFKPIRKRRKNGRQPEYFIPDIEREFPSKAKGLSTQITASQIPKA